jgi:hypothetical protein
VYGIRTKLLCCVGLTLLLPPGSASPTTNATMESQVVPGWAGYAVRAGAESFDGVHGRWVQPRVICNRPGSAAAFWIGLGGARRQSRALEQVGTSVDCSDLAEASYSAWYQLWPARAVELPITVRSGDHLDAAVSVNGAVVTIALQNLSTGAAVTKDIVTWAPESDSAEWIVEAPAMCFAICTLVPLATFGSVTFTETVATLKAHTGSISDPLWTPSRFTMGVRRVRPRATTSPLVQRGLSFTVLRSQY